MIDKTRQVLCGMILAFGTLLNAWVFFVFARSVYIHLSNLNTENLELSFGLKKLRLFLLCADRGAMDVVLLLIVILSLVSVYGGWKSFLKKKYRDALVQMYLAPLCMPAMLYFSAHVWELMTSYCGWHGYIFTL